MQFAERLGRGDPDEQQAVRHEYRFVRYADGDDSSVDDVHPLQAAVSHLYGDSKLPVLQRAGGLADAHQAGLYRLLSRLRGLSLLEKGRNRVLDLLRGE